MSYFDTRNGVRADTCQRFCPPLKKGVKPRLFDDMPVEVWKCLEKVEVDFLTGLFNRILDNKKMPGE